MSERIVSARTCVACREVRAKKQLVRIVRTPAGEVDVDTTGKVPGRGAYICRERSCLDKAWQSNRLRQALKASIPEALHARLVRTLAEKP